jgi:hypothetical protein
MLEGSKNRGKAFFISHEQARRLIAIDPKNIEVVIPIISGSDITDTPDQTPKRSAIFFFDWPIERASQYEEPFGALQLELGSTRADKSDDRLSKYWWQFERPRIELYRKIRPLLRCFAACATSKYLNFVAQPASRLFTQGAKIFASDRWDLYAIVQSTLHEVWARKYSGALKQDLRYSPSKCFDTFPFPEGMMREVGNSEVGNREDEASSPTSLSPYPLIAQLGEHYHEHRRALMLALWLGLTDLYNLFHTRDLTPEQVAKVSKKEPQEAEAGYQGILELRRLHRQLDEAVRDAYGWGVAGSAGPALDLGHDFHEVETLAENDRVRYTISPAARKELLKRLLAENHRRAAVEANRALAAAPPKSSGRGRKVKPNPAIDMFAGSAPPGPPTLFPNDLPPEVWQTPKSDDPVLLEMQALAAVLKAVKGARPINEIRIAALLTMQPLLLRRSLESGEVPQWERLVGAEAKPLPAGVATLHPTANLSWGRAVQTLRAVGGLIEEAEARTWAPGTGLDDLLTEGWADGRAVVALHILQRRGAEAVQSIHSSVLQERADAEAA